MKVQCDVERDEGECWYGGREPHVGQYNSGAGRPLYADEPPGTTTAACRRCGNATECAGTTGRSVRRALLMLRDTCPRNEKNFYFGDGDDEDQ